MSLIAFVLTVVATVACVPKSVSWQDVVRELRTFVAGLK